MIRHRLQITVNPPFIGANNLSKEQKNDILEICGDEIDKGGLLDYVSAWYIKATHLRNR